jgi:hypothetical protein
MFLTLLCNEIDIFQCYTDITKFTVTSDLLLGK